ncbi:unnamed protein product, partial [Mesorhabditis belari]|uniref:Uncharacterized protein n=1 Tax=Mesorhabditis belari TaxID=2138241 RepID=A0AAF3J4D4_9BILA
MSIFHLYYVLKYISNGHIQTDLYYLVFMYPVTSLCGTIGMYLPRAAPFLYSVALVYYMLCLFVVISLLFNIFGTREQMADYLKERNIPISFQVTPLCCLKCLPKLPPTQRNLRRCEWMVFQTPLVRCVLEVANVAVFLELNSRKHSWFVMSNLVGLISMCVAFYGCYVLVPLASLRLQAFRFGVLFRMVDISQCLYTIQKFCLDLAANLEWIEGDQLMGATAKAQFWTSFMLTWEMLVLSLISTHLMRPEKSALFDR